MTTAERIVAESKNRGTSAIRNIEVPLWMKENAESRMISSIVMQIRMQRNVIARGGIGCAV